MISRFSVTITAGERRDELPMGWTRQPYTKIIAFMNKSLSMLGQQCRKRGTRNTARSPKITPLLLCQSITHDHRPLVSIFRKDVTTLLKRLQCIILILQCIMLKIHQYKLYIMNNRPGSDLYITDWP